jgi:hypothetical protein
MGLLGDLYSYIDTKKRQARRLLNDPLGEIAAGVKRFGNDWNDTLNLQANAYPMPGDKTVLNSPEQIAAFRRQLADKGANMAFAATNITPAERAQRMADMGMERGWFRGGEKPNLAGNRTGPWYTQDAQEAAGYAKNRGGDVREYAIPASGFFKADKGYNSKLAHDVAAIVDDPYYGKQGAFLAKELRGYGQGEQVPGYELWQSLESRFGNDGAASVLERLGFKGAKGITRGPEAMVFKNAPVRDAEKAAFDFKNVGKDDIYGKVSIPMIGLLGGGAFGVNQLLRMDDQATP